MWRQLSCQSGQPSGYQPSVLVGEFTILDWQGKVLQQEQRIWILQLDCTSHLTPYDFRSGRTKRDSPCALSQRT